MSRLHKTYVSAVLFLITMALNLMSTQGWINGLSQADVSARYRTLITPASYAFSIWSIIYILLLGTIIYFIYQVRNRQLGPYIEQIQPFLWITFICNILWTFFFSYEYIFISFIILFFYWLVLVGMMMLMNMYCNTFSFLIPVTFGLYTGWITFAMVVNLLAAFVQWNPSFFTSIEEVWSALFFVIALLLVIGLAVQLRNVIFPLPAIWASIAIYYVHRFTMTYDDIYASIEIISIFAATILLALTGLLLFINGFHIIPNKPGIQLPNLKETYPRRKRRQPSYEQPSNLQMPVEEDYDEDTEDAWEDEVDIQTKHEESIQEEPMNALPVPPKEIPQEPKRRYFNPYEKEQRAKKEAQEKRRSKWD